MSEKFRYPTLHWLATLVVGPILLLAYASLAPGTAESNDDLMIYVVALVAGALISLPTYVVYLFAFRWLSARVASPLALVALCNVLVIGCAGLTFLLIGGGAILRFFVLYAIAVILSSMLPRIRLGSR